MIKIKKLSAVLIILGSFFWAESIFARQNVNDWYIQDFQTQISVREDSSLEITEKITADCGQAPDKHGIFRILPETINLPEGKIKTPVELVAITDFSGRKLKYSQSRNRMDNTVTWKIGDPNRTVTGVNEYLIKYRVENAIRGEKADFDELYWNLNGNFWELETDNFSAKIIFPAGINSQNSEVYLYSGLLGQRGNLLADYSWDENQNNILNIRSMRMLFAKEGVTVSVTFPKDIVAPYVPGFWKTYGKFFYLLLPLMVFFFAFNHWRKYGKDPKISKTVIAEYDPPGNLEPMELGMLFSNGTFDNAFITAEIINFATKGLLTIREKNSKILFFKLKDYELEKIDDSEKEKKLNGSQKKILNKIFEDGKKVDLSDLKSTFHEVLNDVEKDCRGELMEKGLLARTGHKYGVNFVVAGSGAAVLAVIFLIFVPALSGYPSFSLGLSGVIFFLFGLAMPKRTLLGAGLNWQIKGFRLFMETAEKYRAQFQEKENIFERLLPYAIVFGMTKEWIKKMKDIYGEKFFDHYAPAWYAGSLASFDADSLSSSIESLSSSITQNTSSSSSGAGGSGGSGGGGGGGGGGGW